MYVPWQVVIASADVEERRAMCNILAKQWLDPIVASTVRECKEIMAQESVGLMFCARSLADGDYRDLLVAARAAGRRIRIVLATRLTDWDEYLEAIRLGAFDVISAPSRPTDVEWMIIQALRDEHARTREITFVQHGVRGLQEASVSNSA
jgi:DNA-binding NtrC family response regulator